MEISGKAPLRISFAGGGTDLDYIFKKYGGAVVNCTIDKFCHMKIKTRDDKEIYINGEKLSDKEILAKKVIEHYTPQFGFDLFYYNDIQPGSGLGSSSSFVILFLRLLFGVDQIAITDNQLVESAYEVESSLKEGGWQDQYACALGGFNFMEFGEQKTVYPLRLKYSFICKLNEHFLLVKVKGEKGDIHKNLREYSENNIEEMKRTSEIQNLAFDMRDCLLNSEVYGIGHILKKNWELKRNQFTSNKKIDDLYKLGLENGAEGGKICGAGQCGHFLFFIKPENRIKLMKVLKDYEIVDFTFSNTGVEIW